MISDLIGGAADKANDLIVDDAKKTVDDLQKLIAGPERTPIDIEKEKAEFIKGEDLSTPTGGPATIPAFPNDARSGTVKSSIFSGARKIEFIHFGHVHLDAARSFHSDEPLDDTKPVDPMTPIGRASYFRAGVEREAVLLAGIARSVDIALAEKDQKEGGLGDLMTLAADLFGGAGGTATSAASSDMKPFTEKVSKAYDLVNKPQIKYTDIHDAGMKLHEVRANLAKYLVDQLGKDKKGAPPPPDGGILSDLPLVGDLPLPGEIGQIVTMFRKVGGKLYDVQTALIFGLTAAMQPAIEQACMDITLDSIRGKIPPIKGNKDANPPIPDKLPPIFPVWFNSLEETKDDGGDKPFADLGPKEDLLGGDLKKTPANKVNEGIRDVFGSVNDGINNAVEKPMEIIDFLSQEAKAAPGHRFLDTAFQAATGEKSLLGGSEKLGEIAVAAFYNAITDDIPEFMKGFVEDFVGYIFAVCVEFLRAVYRILCSMPPTALVNTDQLVAAGSAHILTHLVDWATNKIGLDSIIEKLSIPIPKPPVNVPGINFPEGNLSAAPIAAMLKQLLVEKVSPYLKPIVEYAMSGLATRLNAQRGWAGTTAMTMEAHLAQLPAELALMFRNTFKPLWDFLTDTVMDIISDAIGKALGPAADALGVAGDALGTASGFIADAQKKAKEAQAFAKNVEDKAGELIKELSAIKVGIGETGDLTDIEKAKDNLVDAVTADPFSDSSNGAGKSGSGAGASFPANRKPVGNGVKIEDSEYEEVSKKNQFPKAKLPPAKQPPAGSAAPAQGASS